MILRAVEDADLITSARKGNVEAFNHLVSRWERRVYNYLLRLTGRSEDSLDLCQDVFLKAYQNIRKLDDPTRFGPWLYRIAHNEAYSMFRKRRPDTSGDAAMAEREPAPGVSPEVSIAVNAAMDRLTPEQREAVVLIEWGERFPQLLPIERSEIRITATMEAPAVHFNPRQTDTGLVIDIVGDNRDRRDVGDANFKIQVPSRSSVDLETRSGQITVSNIQGDLVRAHVWTSGDIMLSGVNAARVFASNTTGNIFFDGEFASGGTYEFKSGQGTISLRLPANCGFRVVATSSSKRISMGEFWNKDMQTLGEGRRITGDVGDGRASVTVTNYQGQINFYRR